MSSVKREKKWTGQVWCLENAPVDLCWWEKEWDCGFSDGDIVCFLSQEMFKSEVELVASVNTKLRGKSKEKSFMVDGTYL